MAYRKTYFRIKSAYEYGEGFQTEEQRQQFRQETADLFSSAGWELHPGQSNAHSDTVTKGQQELYLHPMFFSGVIDEDEVPQLEALLASATTFRWYHTDLYEVYVEMSDEEYLAHLESRRTEIAAVILERYKTKRSNLYITGAVDLAVAKEFVVHRICDRNGKREKANSFVSELIEQLIDEGRLITSPTKSGVGIRAATKADLKRLKF